MAPYRPAMAPKPYYRRWIVFLRRRADRRGPWPRPSERRACVPSNASRSIKDEDRAELEARACIYLFPTPVARPHTTRHNGSYRAHPNMLHAWSVHTEAKKSFSRGFQLTEAEVRRLANDIHEQFAKNISHPIVSSFEVQFRNGTIAHFSNLDDVLYESNSGPKLITRFRMSFSLADSDPPSRSASIQFVHPWRHLFSNSVTYTVRSSDRDWALVVTSFIEERLSAIKRGLDPVSLMQWSLWTSIPITLGVLLFFAYDPPLPIGDRKFGGSIKICSSPR